MIKGDWAVVIPFFNEEDFLESCLFCIIQQMKRPAQVILVNNASSDASPLIAQAFAEKYGHLYDIELVDEPEPGKIKALATGTAKVNTTYFAVWDADTFYPPFYLERAHAAYQKSRKAIAAVIAANLKRPVISYKSLSHILKIQLASKVFRSECQVGGYAQTFRTDLYRQVGGFDVAIWPFVLGDHEICQRLLKVGKLRYPVAMWCLASKRRKNRQRVSWTRMEQILYRYTPFFLKDWFFYSFLKPRFKARGLMVQRLREQPWRVE